MLSRDTANSVRRMLEEVVRPGGTAVVMELAPHRETWMHDDLGDRHLGLDSKDVLSAMRRAGFTDLTDGAGLADLARAGAPVE